MHKSITDNNFFSVGREAGSASNGAAKNIQTPDNFQEKKISAVARKNESRKYGKRKYN